MSIERFIKTVCVQTAVYWGNPRPDGYGGFIYDEPREIRVRWDDKIQVIESADGAEIISSAQLLVTEDLELEGVLWLGKLEDLMPESESESESESKTPMSTWDYEGVLTAGTNLTYNGWQGGLINSYGSLTPIPGLYYVRTPIGGKTPVLQTNIPNVSVININGNDVPVGTAFSFMVGVSYTIKFNYDE